MNTTMSFNSTNDVLLGVSNIGVTVTEDLVALISKEEYWIFAKAALVVWLLISLFGICTNIWNIRTFIRMGPEDSVTVLFLALSISDFSICNLAFGEGLSTLFDIISHDYGIVLAIPPNIPRLYLYTLRRILSVITILTTVFLAIQRCLCVIIPLKVKGMFTRRATYVYLLASLIFATVPYCFYVAQYRVVAYFDQARNMTRYKLGSTKTRRLVIDFVSTGMGVVFNVAAQILVNACLIVMAYGLWKSIQFKKSASTAVYRDTTAPGQAVTSVQNKSSANKERQALIQVAIVSTIFVITNSPYLIFVLTSYLDKEVDLYGAYRNLFIVLNRINTIVEIVNSSFNLFVYYRYNSKFRKLCFRSISDGKGEAISPN